MANKFITISTAGAKTLAAPAAGDIASGTLAAARMPAFTGDATSTAGTVALALAAVNSNTGTFGSSSTIPVLTLDAKGRVTAASSVKPQKVILDIGFYSPSTTQGIGGSFTTVDYHSTAATTDTASAWSTTNNAYTVPVAGVYEIVSKLRFADNTGNYSFGQGVDSSNADAPWFAWADFPTGATGGYNRFTHINTRIAHFAAGTVLHHYAYCDGTTATVNAASLNVNLLAAD